MLCNSGFPISVLLASPQANGFYGANGVSGNIPALYVYLSMLFYRKIQAIGKAISLLEYSRPEWTFHAKGTWIEPSKTDVPWAATIVGSSNYGLLYSIICRIILHLLGYRSTFRDLESQVLIVTSNRNLRKRISDVRF
jgi:CDP-diacylglycerol--glycerol-3-phosphate 3-phosphatidyltransferase